jgi:hypothetical protein
MIIYNIKPATTVLGKIVITQAKTICFPKRQLTADNLVVGPTPIIAPDTD